MINIHTLLEKTSRISNNRNFLRIFNLTVCAFGIQFGSALQMANMSSIYRFLGASTDNLAYLWLAGPVSGLLMQPLIGYLSDHNYSALGRRRPYMLIWAACAFISLLLMPNVTALWMAAVLLWTLDFSNNGATEPSRALIADVVSKDQRVFTFGLQAAFSGAGAFIAAIFPWLMHYVFGLDSTILTNNGIPLSIKLAFYLGGTAFLLATLWTVLTVHEEIPAYLIKAKHTGKRETLFKEIAKWLRSYLYDLTHLPESIRQFYPIQLFTWVGMFCMWLYLSLAVAEKIFGLPPDAIIADNPLYQKLLTEGTEWAGIGFATYQFSSVFYALLLPRVAKKIGLKIAYGICLLLGAVGLVSIGFIHAPLALIACMLGMGAAWGGIMSLPSTIISLDIPREKMGTYMGLFNVTVTVPQIICALSLGLIVRTIFHNNAVYLVMMGGIFIGIGGLLIIRQALRSPVPTERARADKEMLQAKKNVKTMPVTHQRH